MKTRLTIGLLLVLAGSVVRAEQTLDMQGTSIIGNQELPKVLYIVPWKKSQLPDLAEPPFDGLMDDALSPIDRAAFQRQLRYYDTLTRRKNGRNENQ